MDWRLRCRSLRLGERTLIMGIVNLTTDSFSDGGLYLEPERAVEHALHLLDQGADLLDLGAESTRPGAQAGNPEAAAVTTTEEQERLLPAIEAVLRQRPDAVISVDTYKAATARAAMAAGAQIVNDVSGFEWDPGMAAACAGMNCGLALMHTRGRPSEWRTQPALQPGRVFPLVLEGLTAALKTAQAAGIAPDTIVLDPGYGFGKRGNENYELLSAQSGLLSLRRPLLVGLSRKSFLKSAHRSQHESASVAAQVAAILGGASIVRVHAVREAVEAAAIADAVLAAG